MQYINQVETQGCLHSVYVNLHVWLKITCFKSLHFYLQDSLTFTEKGFREKKILRSYS